MIVLYFIKIKAINDIILQQNKLNDYPFCKIIFFIIILKNHYLIYIIKIKIFRTKSCFCDTEILCFTDT